MAIKPEQYKLKPTESIPEYNTRIAKLGGERNTTPTSTKKKGTKGKGIDEITKKLLEQADVVTSEDTDFDKFVTESVEDIEEAAEKRKSGVEARFERLRGEAREAGERRITATTEARRGFATNTAVLRQLREENKEDLRDLDQREQEALAVGAQEDAAAIRQLKLQKISFQQQREQQVYQNLFSMLGIQLQQRAETRRAEAQTAEEQRQMASVALDYGVEIREGDTFQSVAARAKETANDIQKLEIEALEAQIEESRARTEQARAGAGGEEPLDDMTASMLAEEYRENPESPFLSSMATGEQQQQVLKKVREQRETDRQDVISRAQETKEAGGSYETFIVDEKERTTLPVGEQIIIEQAANEVWERDTGVGTGKDGGGFLRRRDETAVTQAQVEKGRAEKKQARKEEITSDIETVKSIMKDAVYKGTISREQREKLKEASSDFLGFAGFGRETQMKEALGNEVFDAIGTLRAGFPLSDEQVKAIKRL